MKLAAGLAILACAATLTAPTARASVDGNVPGPGLCDYPGIGQTGMIMGEYNYLCDFPTEENGSHWHCEYGGAVIQGQIGISIALLRAGIQLPIGALEGSCSWRCPNNTLAAAAPNPPGAWKDHLRPRACITAAPPKLPDAPDPQTQAVTNPVEPNPVATDDSDSMRG